MKQTLQSRFLHVVAPHLSSGILSPTDYETIIKSLHTRAVTTSESLLSHKRVLQTSDGSVVSFQKTAVAVLASVEVFLKTAVAVLIRLC